MRLCVTREWSLELRPVTVAARNAACNADRQRCVSCHHADRNLTDSEDVASFPDRLSA